MHEHLFLAVHDAQAAQRIFRLGEGTAIVGRLGDCDIQLVDSSVSRRHAEFVRRNRQFFVRDLGSMNGTYVNNCRVDNEQPVRVCDRLRFGGVGCQLFASEQVAIDVLQAGPDESTKSVGGASNHHPPGFDRLTRCQRQVLNQLIVGKAEKDIGESLGISPNTVHAHVTNIYRTMLVHSRAELMALFLGSVPPPPDFDKTLGFRMPPE